MSSPIRTVFILLGFYAGKTINLGGYQFVDGKFELIATPEDTGLVARSFERNWQAYPEGHPALAKKDDSNGKRDLSPAPLGNEQSQVHGGVQSSGEGAQAGGEGQDNGSGAGGAAAGASTELAAGDGQQAGVNGDGDGDGKPEVNTKLVKALKKLDPADDSHWTSAGLPAMVAVEGFYGAADITRADVEAAAPGLTRASATAAAK